MTVANEQRIETSGRYVKKAVPVILFFFVLSLIIDNAFKLISVDIAKDLGISATTVGWQATLAGLIIGIGAVVYASLADSISIRTLLTTGVILICAGSLLGYFFHSSYTMILIARVIQTAGLASAETLYVIYVSKYLPKAEQKKFLGFSTSSYSLSLVVGSLAGGYISTYLHWTTLFLVPLVTLFILPFILKYLPKEKAKETHVDVWGLLLIAAIATALMLYLTNFNLWNIAGLVVAVILFSLHISKNPKSLIGISFFKNSRFVSTLTVAFVIYSVQLGYIFMFPFILDQVYGLHLDTISLLLIPGYVTAIVVGALSGKIAEVFSSKQAIAIAIILIAVSLLLPAIFANGHVILYVISMVLFSGSFAFMYAPMLDTCISLIPEEKVGTAIGFFNLTLNVAASIGIAYTAALMDKVSFSKALVFLVCVAAFALLLFGLLLSRSRKTA